MATLPQLVIGVGVEMGVIGGKRGYQYVAVPWGDNFDQQLMKVGESTYRFSGDDLLHEIHKTTIEANHINIRLYKATRLGLNLLIVCQAAMIVVWLVR